MLQLLVIMTRGFVVTSKPLANRLVYARRLQSSGSDYIVSIFLRPYGENCVKTALSEGKMLNFMRRAPYLAGGKLSIFPARLMIPFGSGSAPGCNVCTISSWTAMTKG